MIFQTKRLKVRNAVISDTTFYVTLWNSGEVMSNVGFPNGLQTSEERIRKQIKEHHNSEFDQTLVVLNKESGEKIGECKIGSPNEEEISCPDFKFLPQYWGKGYGKELIIALCKYTFSNTRTQIIETSPSEKNVASQKIIEFAGAKEIRRGIYRFPQEMQHYTKDVPCIIYQIRKENWLEKNLKINMIRDKAMKSRSCKIIIEALPNWFGIPESNKEYIKGVAVTDFYEALMFGKEVGFISIIHHFKETSEIYVCGILSDFHNLGIGTKLISTAEDDLRKKKKKFLTVKTLSSSHPDASYAKTREFYKACGFVPVEEFKELWGKENPCLLLVKML